MQTAHSLDAIAAKLRLRIGRRRKLGYLDTPISILDLEQLIEAAIPVAEPSGRARALAATRPAAA